MGVLWMEMKVVSIVEWRKGTTRQSGGPVRYEASKTAFQAAWGVAKSDGSINGQRRSRFPALPLRCVG